MEQLKKIEYLDTPMLVQRKAVKQPNPFLLKAIQWNFRLLGRVFPKWASKIAYRLFTTPQFRAKHKRSDQWIEQARVFDFMYGKQLLKGYEWGEGEKVVLLVHGWESRGTAMRAFVPGLLELGYRVVAFDGPAHGHSGGKRTNIAHFGGAIRALIRQVGEIDGIIAHSFGGSATVYALTHLEVPVQLKRLVLIAAPSRMDRILTNFINMIKAPRKVAEGFHDIIKSKVKRPIEETDIGKSYDSIIVEQAMIVHDEHDPIVSIEESKHTFEHWDNSTLIVTKGLGHYHLMKNEEVLSKVKAFFEYKIN